MYISTIMFVYGQVLLCMRNSPDSYVMISILRATKSRWVAMCPVWLRHQTCVGYGDDSCWKVAKRWQFYVKMDL